MYASVPNRYDRGVTNDGGHMMWGLIKCTILWDLDGASLDWQELQWSHLKALPTRSSYGPGQSRATACFEPDLGLRFSYLVHARDELCACLIFGSGFD